MNLRTLLAAPIVVSLLFPLFSGCGGKAPPEKNGLAKSEDKYLGNIVQNEVPSDFTQYWNQMTLENASKWGSVEHTRGTMDWDVVDEAYQYALDHNVTFNQHSFVWGSQQPNWMANLSAEAQAQALEQWMKLFCERFPQTHLVTVVNSPINDPPGYAAGLGGAGDSGWDWVIWSFEKARQHCPLQTLILSEYLVIKDAQVRSDYKSLVDLLKSKNLIDGVGLQALALGQQGVSVEEMTNALTTLSEAGLPIYVTEMYVKNTNLTDQRDTFASLFPVVWEHPNVQGVTLWGYRYQQSFEEADLLLDNNEPSPAMQWLMDYFQARE